MLGGLAIWLSAVISVQFFVPHTTYSWVILRASTFLFLVGLIDDIVHIKPYQKVDRTDHGLGFRRLLRPLVALDQFSFAEHGAGNLLAHRKSRMPSTCSTTWTDSRRVLRIIAAGSWHSAL